jgi:enterochelin esterase-like enzyme
MIIVMTTGYAFEEGKKYAMIPGDIHKEIAEDLVPFIDKRYRTIPEKDSRAIAGLSLGSAVAWKTGLEYRKTVFSYLGMFSGGLSRDGRRGSFDSGDIFDKGDEFNSDIKVLYAAWGSEEPVGKTNMEFIEEVAKNGIDVKHDTYFGWHEWDVWRHAAASFMQLIFR